MRGKRSNPLRQRRGLFFMEFFLRACIVILDAFFSKAIQINLNGNLLAMEIENIESNVKYRFLILYFGPSRKCLLRQKTHSIFSLIVNISLSIYMGGDLRQNDLQQKLIDLNLLE